MKNRKEKRQRTSFSHTLSNNFYMMRMLWQISPSRVILTFVSQMLSYGMWTFQSVVFMRYIFGAAEETRTFRDVALFLGFCLFLWLIVSVFQIWYDRYYKFINNTDIWREMSRKIFDKACNVEIECYENTEFYNVYTRAASEAAWRGISVVDNLAKLISSLLSSSYVIYVITTINLYVGIAAAVMMVANFILSKMVSRIDYERDMEMTPHNRQKGYVNRSFYLQKYAKEIRLTNVYQILEKSYRNAVDGILGVCMKYWRKRTFLMASGYIVKHTLPYEGVWLISAYLAMVSKSILVSEFVVLANAIVSATWMVFGLTDSIMSIYSNSLYIDNVRTFLEYKEKIPENQTGLPIPEICETLEVRNVSFRYTENSDYVLKNISITFKTGEITSIVGHNGSGKSTLIKLIMRLYDPTEGEILLNGVNIKEYCLKGYRNKIGATFQDYQIFSLSVLENVIMGNETEGDAREAALDALRKSGNYDKIMSLEGAEHTTLTREFDDHGTNLSGGEMQKVAISRAFAKKSDILLLDEPSSALDPVAEYEMFENFIDLCKNEKGKISIFISHRLSSTTVADCVMLLENGVLTERGTHAELMKKDGSYAGMFKKQAENYLLGRFVDAV